MAYLNDDFEGGRTIFYPSIGNLPVCVIPRRGSILIFNHDVKHAGEIVTGDPEALGGFKYILRTELMFRRVEARHGVALKNPALVERTALALQLHKRSAAVEAEGDVEESTRIYLEALAIQAEVSSTVPPGTDLSPFERMSPAYAIVVLKQIPPELLARTVMRASWAMRRVAREGELWGSFYSMRYPERICCESIVSIDFLGEKDWYGAYKAARLLENGSPPIVISATASSLKCRLAIGLSECIHDNFTRGIEGVKEFVEASLSICGPAELKDIEINAEHIMKITAALAAEDMGSMGQLRDKCLKSMRTTIDVLEKTSPITR